jgi:hypothetical protein
VKNNTLVSSQLSLRIMESLRKGIPPDGHVREFTVGRESEIKSLTNQLRKNEPGALLLKANYGSGKSHLLRFMREAALENGYAVSYIVLDVRAEARFNRMDQVLGRIWRGLEVPSDLGQKGVRPFFDFVCTSIESAKLGGSQMDFWHQLTNNYRWDYSGVLDSAAMFIALRAWSTKVSNVQNLVEDWLFQPWTYQTQRKLLYKSLIGDLRSYFHDPRPEWKFYAVSEGLFDFRAQSYAQSWASLRDLQTLARAVGLRGVVILVDEFEDVVYNMNNIQHQEAAFWNLFQFFASRQFPGMSFFAVTPGFVQKCKSLLQNKGRWDYDYSRFESLPTFEMSPLELNDLKRLADKIESVHAVAYNWDPVSVVDGLQLSAVVKQFASIRIEDRTRQTIREVVKFLDRVYEDQ